MKTQTEANQVIQKFSKETGKSEGEVWGFVKIVDRLAEQLVFLSDAGKTLSASLDVKLTFNHLVKLIVPYLADWCTVSLVKSNGEIERIASLHADKNKDNLVKQLEHRYPPNRNSPIGPPFVIRTGKSEFVETLNENPKQVLKGYSRSEELANLFNEIGVISYMTIPMILKKDRKVIGAIWFAYSDSGRHYTRNDLYLAQDLTAIAAQAVYNSTLYGKAIDDTERLQGEKAIRESYIQHQIEDIKTPLTAAMLMIQMLPKMCSTSEKISELSMKAAASIQKAVQILENLASGPNQFIEPDQNVLHPGDNELAESA